MKADEIPDDMASFLRRPKRQQPPSVPPKDPNKLTAQDADAFVRDIQPKQPEIPADVREREDATWKGSF